MAPQRVQHLQVVDASPAFPVRRIRYAAPIASEDPRDARIRELERQNAALRARLADADRTIEARLQVSIEAAGLGAWERDLRTSTGHWSETMAALHGINSSEVPSHDEWLARIDPLHRGAMHDTMAALLDGTSDHFEATYRYQRPDGISRWVWSRGAVIEREPTTGRPVRIAGVARDDTDRHENEIRRDLLSREVDHRAKNALAVVQSVIKLTRADTVQGYANAVDGRIAALARAHDLLSRNTWTGAELTDVLAHELAPFLSGSGKGSGERGRATMDGPGVLLTPLAAQPLSMALHELATNAAKYGALSTPAGRLHVQWLVHPASPSLRIRWIEQGGPSLAVRPGRKGFGTRVLEGTIHRQLGGTLQTLWEPEGLVCDIQIPRRHLAAMGRENGRGNA